MEKAVQPDSIWRRPLVLTAAVAILLVQAAATYGLARMELLPNPPPLAVTIPFSFGEWVNGTDVQEDSAILAQLGPDDFLSRYYVRKGTSETVHLFVTYHKSQFLEKAAHSPKVCLPGGGWATLDSTTIAIPVAGRSQPVVVNYYLIGLQQQQKLVFYWFQTHKRVVANEYALKLHRIADSMLDNRSDMIFVRVVIPVNASDTAGASERLTLFAQEIYPLLLRQFPSLVQAEGV